MVPKADEGVGVAHQATLVGIAVPSKAMCAHPWLDLMEHTQISFHFGSIEVVNTQAGHWLDPQPGSWPSKDKLRHQLSSQLGLIVAKDKSGGAPAASAARRGGGKV